MMSRFEVSRHLSVLLAYLIAYYSLLMEWPQPALALRDAIRAHVNGAGVGDTEYGKNMNELAATLNVAAAPAETDNFCGTRRWAHKIDPREAGALGTKIEDVQAAHTKLGEMPQPPRRRIVRERRYGDGSERPPQQQPKGGTQECAPCTSLECV